MGGDDTLILFSAPIALGLPPHGRGRLGLVGRVYNLTGITPAWAGTTGVTGRRGGVLWDYPRMGGDDQPVQGNVLLGSGLPPHGRGRHFLTRDFTAVYASIVSVHQNRLGTNTIVR